MADESSSELDSSGVPENGTIGGYIYWSHLLPIIGFLFVVESLSVIIQVTSKKLRKGKKVFLSAPIHHHFEAVGWPEAKVVMRFWVISGVMAIIGLVVFFMDTGAWR